MYLRTCSNSKPTVDTAYPRAQKCSPVKFRSLPHKRAIAIALFPFRNPITEATGYLRRNATVKPFLVSLVEPVAYLKSELAVCKGESWDCLFTRHHDGLVRQTHLARIIRSRNAWIPCFVVPLVGEYVVEILRVVHENLTHLETSIYADFLGSNPEFLNLTEQRVVSYWDCYYRSIKKNEYPGFLILDFLKSITKSAPK